MTVTRAVRTAMILIAMVGAMAPAVAAQTNDEATPFPSLQWNFSTPGARANSMGRSFIGLADDASAAVTNPAGLTNLTRVQIYAEYKNTQLKVDRLAAVDALRTLAPTTNTANVNSLSFLSVSAPVSNKIAVAFSVFRFLDYHEAFNLAPRAIPGSASNSAFLPIDGNADFTATAFGGSFAYNVTAALRVGVTVSGSQLKADSVATRSAIAFGRDYPAPGQSGGNLNDLAKSGIIVNETSIHASQIKPSAELGVLYKINDMISVGANFAKGPKFTSEENLRTNPGFDPRNLAGSSNRPLEQGSGFPKPFELNVPDYFGFGIAVRPTSRLLIAADGVHTNYSSLSRNTTLVFNSATTLNGSEYVTPDVTEIHIGGEYNIYQVMGNPIFVRGGFFSNPSHLVTYVGSSDAETNAAERAKYNLLPRTDERRGTVGAGIAIGPRGQIDAAYVIGKEFVLSAAARF
jgi:long-chain fatty acid transport protein